MCYSLSMEIQSKKPFVYAYHDYRSFLKDSLSYLKRSENLSMRKLSEKIGISHGYLSLVLKGQRSLSSEVVKKIAPFLDLTTEKQKYLNHLVSLADSSSNEEKRAALKSLKRSRSYSENHPKEFETYQYLDKWHTVAIREMVSHPGFQDDPIWIQQQLNFPIRRREIEESLIFLKKHHFMRPAKLNGWKQATKNVSCLGGVFQLAMRQFHTQMLSLAQNALSIIPKKERKQIGYVFSISSKDFLKVCEVIEEAKEKIKKIEEASSPSNKVAYYANFSAFPLTQKGEKS